MRFEGKTALVTGASRGLGRHIAVALAAEGAWVALGCRRRVADANSTLDAMRAAGGDGAVSAFDVREFDEVRRAVDEVLSARGRVDVAVHCAGIARDGYLATATTEDVDDVLRTNLHGAMHLARCVARPMLASKRGAIVFVTSVAGIRASAGQASYSASKGALVSLTATLAAELGAAGVRVNALAPGLIAAGMVERLPPRALEERRLHIPLGRLGHPDEVARAALFLASDDASYITGHTLVIDGGLSL